MNNDNFLETLVTNLTPTADVTTVFGDPVQAGAKVIIPVAQVMLGTGGGYGYGRSLPGQATTADAYLDRPRTPGGGGGGGGVYARAQGVFEITPEKTRFIAARDGRSTLLMLAVGFLLGRLLAPGRSQAVDR